jgi:hypothetical protein
MHKYFTSASGCPVFLGVLKHIPYKKILIINYLPSNALSSAMDLNFDTFFSDDIFPGRKAIDIATKGKLLLICVSLPLKKILKGYSNAFI